MIPARQGSKGIVNKNFRKLAGTELIEHTLSHAIELADLADIVVSSDNYGYLDILQARFSGIMNKPTHRPNWLISPTNGFFLHYRSQESSSDDALIIPVIREVILAIVGPEPRENYEGVVLLQPTTPFRSNTDLSKLREYLLNRASASGSFVTFVQVSDGHPARMYFSDTKSHFRSSGFLPDFETSRRQDLPPVYLRDGCYYFVGMNLINQGLQVGKNPEGYIREYPWSINLDSQDDWTLAESIVDMPNWSDLIRKGEPN